MNYDVIIIGGGPAGSTAATYLAKAGKRVLVLEKEHFPRFHIGESLLPYNMPIFEEMGVMPALQSADFMTKKGGRFSLAKGGIENSIIFSEGAFTEVGEAIQVERSIFDKILLDHARDSGAEVYEGWRVERYSICAQNGVSVTASNEHEETFSASFLLDASGLVNFTANREKLRQCYPHLQKVAIYGHFTGVNFAHREQQKHETHIACFRDSWIWVIPFSEEKVSVGLVLGREDLRKSDLSPEEIFQQAIDSSPSLTQMMERASRLGSVRSTSDYSYSNEKLVGPRLLRVGDAVGFIDPIFSSGVYLACVTSRDAARALVEAFDSNQALSASMRRYEKQTRKILSRYREVVDLFYQRSFVEILLQPSGVLQWPCAINAILAGRIDLPWALRWRFKTFLWFARVHHRLGIVKRLNFG